MRSIQLHNAAKTWGAPNFNDVLKAEIEQLDLAQLPLQAGLSQSSYVSDEPFRAMIISAIEADGYIHVRAGIFYAGIIAGCNCSDDPTPVESQPEYCEALLTINRKTGDATIALARD